MAAMLKSIGISGVIQAVLAIALAMNWWATHESKLAAGTASETVILQSHSDRLRDLETTKTSLLTAVADLQAKVNFLVVVAEQQQKRQK